MNVIKKYNDFNEDIEYSFNNYATIDNFIKDKIDNIFEIYDIVGSKADKAKLKYGKNKFKEDIILQRAGVDKQVLLLSGNEINIDIKHRRQDYGDILLEEYSKFNEKKLGWLLKPNEKTDYIIYYIEESDKLYWLPYILLRSVFIKNKEIWRESNKFCELHNEQHFCAKNINKKTNEIYYTTNIAVNTDELFILLDKEMKSSLKKYNSIKPSSLTDFIIKEKRLLIRTTSKLDNFFPNSNNKKLRTTDY